MAEALYISRCTIENVAALHRRTRLATGETMDIEVRGPIMDLFSLAPERSLPLPVDHVVAATGGAVSWTAEIEEASQG